MTTNEKKNITELRGKGMSYRAISESTGISINTVSSFCRRTQIDGQSKDIKNVGTCKNCGRLIKSKTGCKPRIFCSDTCRWEWWNRHLDQVKRKAVYSFTCACCGKEFSVYGNKNRKYCSRTCYIAGRYGREVSAHD